MWSFSTKGRPSKGASRRRLSLALAATLSLGSLAGAAVEAQESVLPTGRDFWIDAGATLAVSAVLDEPLRRFAATHQRHAIDQLAGVVDPFGRATYLVPALVGATVVPWVAGDHPLAMKALRVGLGYAAADLAGGVLRTAIARHRPDSTGRPWRLRPLRPEGEWGSLPSAHVTHAFAIAAGIAAVSGRPWMARAAYDVASLVALQRIYRERHWASDVVVGATLATDVARRAVDARFLAKLRDALTRSR
jgi:membrane-associated phospholipid phosphatase